MTWKYVYASVPGTSHHYLGKNCQDASKVSICETSLGEQILICVASDGAGSASHSELASQLLTRLAIGCVKKWMKKEPSLEKVTQANVALWIKIIKKKLIQKAEELGIERRQLASTFLLAVIGEQRSIFAQIGDGAIVITNSEKYECVFWPQNGEYQNMTYFITDEDSLKTLQITFRDYAIDELSIFTDGIQMLALSYKDNSPYPPFFEPLFASLRRHGSGQITHLSEFLKAFLESERVNEKTDDDKTLILATRKIAAPEKVEVYAGQFEET